MTAAETSVHIVPASRIEGYEFTRVLGEGGFGVTYLARELESNARVAVKEYFPSEIATRTAEGLIRPKTADEADTFEWGLRRFVDEAQTLARFRHSNIVGVRRLLRANDTAYMVMDYQDGTSLGKIVENYGDLEESEIRRILDPLLDGLEQVHDAGVLHRDIKPDNIFIRADGSPVLLDFGAARIALGHRSKSLHKVFTPGYASPEQYETDGRQGPWTDIYGMAAVFYSLICGRAPIEAPRRTGAFVRGHKDPLEPAQEVGRGRYAPSLLRSIDWGLRINDSERPQSVADWRATLHGADAPTPAGQIGEATIVQKAVEKADPHTKSATAGPTRISTGAKRRRRVVAAVTTGLLLVAVAGVGIAWWLGGFSGSGDSRERLDNRPASAAPVWIVAKTGGDSTTLADAMRRAPAGARIRIRPGTYAGPLLFDRRLFVEGDAKDARAVRIVTAGPCAIFRITAGLKNVTLFATQLGGHEGCVRVLAGAPRIVGNRIRNFGGPGIVVLGGEPYIADNLVANNGAQGMLIEGEGAAPVIERNRMIGNARSGLRFGRGAGGRVLYNRVLRNRHHGVWLRRTSNLHVAGNQIYDNHGIGLLADAGSQARVLGNTVLGNRGGQIGRHRESTAQLKRNIVE